MPLCMARPMRLNGVYYFRQRVPKDVLPRVGKSWIKESLRTSDPAVAKQRHTDACAKYAACWNELRRSPSGMNAREATSIAGEVYKEFLERHSGGARTMWTAHHWSWRAAVLAVATGEEDKPSSWDGVKTPDWDIFERDAGDELRTVLRRAGMAVDDASFRSLLFKSAKAVLLGIHKLIRECGDDFRPDPEVERVSAFVAPKDRAAKSTLSNRAPSAELAVTGRRLRPRASGAMRSWLDGERIERPRVKRAETRGLLVLVTSHSPREI